MVFSFFKFKHDFAAARTERFIFHLEVIVDAVLAVHVSAVWHDEDELVLELLSRQALAIAVPVRLLALFLLHKCAKLVFLRIEHLETVTDPLANLPTIFHPAGDALVELDRLLVDLKALDYKSDSQDARQENDRDAEE